MHYLHNDLWESFYTYLLIEKKLTITSTKSTSYLYSRFNIIQKQLDGKPFNRESFGLVLMQMKQKGYSNAYLNNLIKMAKHLNGFFLLRYGADLGLSDYTYFRKERTIIDPLTVSEIKALAEVKIPYRYLPEETNEKYRTLIYTLAMTGARINEVLSLKKNHVFNTHVVFYGSKIGDERMVPINKFLYDLLTVQMNKSESDLVFSNKGKMIHDTTTNADFKRRAEVIGLNKRVYNHIFRHSFVVQMLKEKVSLVHISRILGHRSLESVNNYSHLLLQDLEDAMNSHPMMRQGQTFEQLKEKVKSAVERAISGTQYGLVLKEDYSNLQIQLKNSSLVNKDEM